MHSANKRTRMEFEESDSKNAGVSKSGPASKKTAPESIRETICLTATNGNLSSVRQGSTSSVLVVSKTSFTIIVLCFAGDWVIDIVIIMVNSLPAGVKSCAYFEFA